MSQSSRLRLIGLIGLGHHARRIYMPFITHARAHDPAIAIACVIDLQSNEAAIRSYLAQQQIDIPSERLLFVPDSYRCHRSLAPDAARLLQSLVQSNSLDSLILSNDPRSRSPYIEFALRHSCALLCDKPLFAPPGQGAAAASPFTSILDEFDHYLRLYRQALSKSSHYFPFVVQSQRRLHPAYQFVVSELHRVLERHSLPISNIDIYHSDGNFMLPHDFARNDSHHYRQGMGKLYHSGYHFIDFLMILLGMNRQLMIKQKKATEQLQNYYELSTRITRPSDWLHRFQSPRIRALFADASANAALCDFGERYREDAVKQLTGEFDFHLLGQTQWAAGNASTQASSSSALNDFYTDCTFSLSLLSSGYSLRRSFATPVDTYKGNGRVRHERLCISLSSLMEIQIHSYQATEKRAVDERPQSSEPPALGDYDHLEVSIFRNAHLIGGPPVEKFVFPNDFDKMLNLSGSSLSSPASGSIPIPPHLSHNEAARWRLCSQFIERQTNSICSLELHRSTHWLLQQIEVAKQQRLDGLSAVSGGVRAHFPTAPGDARDFEPMDFSKLANP